MSFEEPDEVRVYGHIERIARALERVAVALESSARRPRQERDLLTALERCALKLKAEYDRQQPDAPPDECWVEAELAWELLREFA